MNSFADRKAARIAKQKEEAGKKFKWQVICTSFYLPPDVDPVLPGLFSNKKLAEGFAYARVGPIAGMSGAVVAINERLGKRISLPDCAGPAHFAVRRVEV